MKDVASNYSRATPSPVPPRLVKTPVAVHPLRQGGEGCKINSPLASLGERGRGGEGVLEQSPNFCDTTLVSRHRCCPHHTDGQNLKWLGREFKTMRCGFKRCLLSLKGIAAPR